MLSSLVLGKTPHSAQFGDCSGAGYHSRTITCPESPTNVGTFHLYSSLWPYRALAVACQRTWFPRPPCLVLSGLSSPLFFWKRRGRRSGLTMGLLYQKITRKSSPKHPI